MIQALGVVALLAAICVVGIAAVLELGRLDVDGDSNDV